MFVRLTLRAYSYQDASRQVCDHAAQAGNEQEQKIQCLTEICSITKLQGCEMYSYH